MQRLSGHVALFLIFFWAIGCGNQWTMQDYIAIHQHGINHLSWANAMDSHFGRDQVDHFITHFGMDGPLTWNSTVYFDGRFILTLQVPVRVDYQKNELAIAGEPEFYLHAISSVKLLPDGRVQGSYAGYLQRQFDEDDWDKLTGKDFDLAVISIPQEEVFAIENFPEYVDAWRKDRQPIP